MGRTLARGLDNWHWVVGDWLVYGEDAFGERVYATKHHPGQSKYAKAAVLTGLSIETLTLCAKVSRAYPLDERVSTASWTRHLEALVFPADSRWDRLRRACTSAEWQTMLNHYRSNNTNVPKKIFIECPKCGHTWRKT